MFLFTCHTYFIFNSKHYFKFSYSVFKVTINNFKEVFINKISIIIKYETVCNNPTVQPKKIHFHKIVIRNLN